MSTQEEIYQRCRSHLLEYVGFRPKTAFEIKEKVSRYLDYYPDIAADVRSEMTERLLDELAELNLFSDLVYAQKYVEEQFSSSQPKSPNEIKAFLFRKGVSHENVVLALSKYDTDMQLEVIKKLIAKKKLPPDKMKNFLLRKGFAFECVAQALETI